MEASPNEKNEEVLVSASSSLPVAVVVTVLPVGLAVAEELGLAAGLCWEGLATTGFLVSV